MIRRLECRSGRWLAPASEMTTWLGFYARSGGKPTFPTCPFADSCFNAPQPMRTASMDYHSHVASSTPQLALGIVIKP
jgi:hypothetical protein